MFSLQSLFSRKQNQHLPTIAQQPAIQVDPVERLLALHDWHLERANHYRAILDTGYVDYKLYTRWYHSRHAASRLQREIAAYAAPSAQQLTLF